MTTVRSNSGPYLLGVGFACPLGNTRQEVTSQLLLKPSVFSEVVQFDASGFSNLSSEGAEVRALNPKKFLKRRKDLKLMSRDARLAVLAAGNALVDSGLFADKKADESLNDGGLFMAVGTEPGDSADVIPMLSHSLSESGDEVVTERLANKGVKYCNPLSSLKTIPNMALAHVSIQFGIMGPSGAFSSTAPGGASALQQGLYSGLPLFLAGAADSEINPTSFAAYNRLGLLGSERSRVGLLSEKFVLGEAGVMFVFSSEQPEGSNKVPCLLGASQRLIAGACERHICGDDFLGVARAALDQAGLTPADLTCIQISDCGIPEVTEAQLAAATELDVGFVFGLAQFAGYCGAATHLYELGLCMSLVMDRCDLAPFGIFGTPQTSGSGYLLSFGWGPVGSCSAIVMELP